MNFVAYPTIAATIQSKKDSLLQIAEKAVNFLGPVPTVILFGLLAGAALLTLYLVLKYGHKAAEMFIPMVKDIFIKLIRETKSEKPVIRVEVLCTVFYGLLIFLATAALLMDSVTFWNTNLDAKFFKELIVASFVITVFLCWISVGLSSRFT
jgi:hypothetical protein